MKIGLLQLDGSQPNLALMRIAAHHRALGDEIDFAVAPTLRTVERSFGDCWDRVYASLIFERTRPVAERLLQVHPTAVVGGTGWSLADTLEAHGIATTALDYSIYPKCKLSIGFTQRGCRLSCSFCVVPRKEGKVRQVATIADIWRGPPWPKHVLLLDNDFFGQAAWRERISEIREGRFKVSFNQGINARMLTDEAAAAIASVDYRDDSMQRKRIYTAWDSENDEGPLFRGLERLKAHGVRPDNIMVYMLIGYHADETEEGWLRRQRSLRAWGARPYPMPFVRNPLTVGFQRWCVTRADLRVPWEEYKAARWQPRNLKPVSARIALPLFDAEE